MSAVANEIRFFHFISEVLSGQQADPLCRSCKAFANTVERMREGLSALEDALSGKSEAIAPEILALRDSARRRILEIKIPEGVMGQKKAGNCKMPEGVCFIKVPKSILEKL